MINIESLNKIKAQIQILKQRFDSMEQTLNIQEEILNLLSEQAKTLCKEAAYNKDSYSVEKIMKRAFSKGTFPKILFKN